MVGFDYRGYAWDTVGVCQGHMVGMLSQVTGRSLTPDRVDLESRVGLGVLNV